MNWAKSDIYSKNLDAVTKGNNVIVNKGGTRSGKTWSLLQLCYTIAELWQGVVISVVGETIPFFEGRRPIFHKLK